MFLAYLKQRKFCAGSQRGGECRTQGSQSLWQLSQARVKTSVPLIQGEANRQCVSAAADLHAYSSFSRFGLSAYVCVYLFGSFLFSLCKIILTQGIAMCFVTSEGPK